MSFKKILLVLFLAFISISLVGCDLIGNIVGNNDNKDTKEVKDGDNVIAKLDSSLLGDYVNEELTITIYESKIKITEASGTTIEYTLYEDGDEIYILENNVKVVFQFNKDTISNIYGTFTKVISGGTNHTLAHLDSTLTGEYFGDGIKVVVHESNVVVIESDGKTNGYSLYTKNGTYYVIDDGEEITCTFSTDGNSVTNKFGTFTKKNGSSGTSSGDNDQNGTVAHLDTKFRGTYYGNGTQITVEESKVSVADASGKVIEFVIYIEKNDYYILENETKVICKFSTDGSSVTNTHGTFIKKTGDPGRVVAKLDSSLQGEYFKNEKVVYVYESNIMMTSNGQISYIVYINNGSYYLLENNVETSITFTNDSLIIGELTYNKRSYSDEVTYLNEPVYGDYYANGIYIVVSKTQVKVTENNVTETYDLFVTEEEIYVMVEGEKVVCRFGIEKGNEFVENKFGRFPKAHGGEMSGGNSGSGNGEGSGTGTGDITTDNKKVAEIASTLWGDYTGNGTMIKITKSSVFIISSSGSSKEYTLYVSEDNKIYFEYNGEVVVCTFLPDGSVSNKFGTFVKTGNEGGNNGSGENGGTSGSDTINPSDGGETAVLDNKYIGKFISENFILLVNPSEISLAPVNTTNYKNFVLYQEGNTYYIIYNNTKTAVRFTDENTVSINGVDTFRRVS